MSYVYLTLAILSEVMATSALKAANEFTRLGPSLLVVVGYIAAFYFLSLTLKTLPLSLAYAIWCGGGIILLALIGVFYYHQMLDVPAILGISLILIGVLVIYLFSSVASS